MFVNFFFKKGSHNASITFIRIPLETSFLKIVFVRLYQTFVKASNQYLPILHGHFPLLPSLFVISANFSTNHKSRSRKAASAFLHHSLFANGLVTVGNPVYILLKF